MLLKRGIEISSAQRNMIQLVALLGYWEVANNIAVLLFTCW